MTLQHSLKLVLQVSILLTVFGFGLRTKLGDMVHVLERPFLLGRALVSMFVIMPILAVVLARAFTLRPAVAIVLIALSISPIPPLLPQRQQKSGGHSTYALGLMAIVSVLSIAIVPAALQLLGQYLGRVFAMPLGDIDRVVFMAAILPLVLGLLVRRIWPTVAERIATPLSRVAMALLACGVLALLIKTFPEALGLTGNGTILVMAAFCGAGLAIGHWMGGPRRDHRVVLALATATRHPAIALAVARVNFPEEPNLDAAIVLYLLVNIFLGIPYAIWQRRTHEAPSDVAST